MKTILISIYDKKAQFFDKPVQTQNEETAIRMITNTMQDEKSQQLQMCKTPEDFALYILGDFDDNDGSILSNVKHIIDLNFILLPNKEEKQQHA